MDRRISRAATDAHTLKRLFYLATAASANLTEIRALGRLGPTPGC